MNEESNLRSQIRSVLQEELSQPQHNQQTSRSPALQLVNRTREMIQNAATTTVNQLSHVMPVRHMPNHPNRLSVSGKGKKKET